MNFHINIKFRAFGITFGTLSDTIDGSSFLASVLSSLLAAVAKSVPEAALINASSLVSQISVPTTTLYNANGVLLTVGPA